MRSVRGLSRNRQHLGRTQTHGDFCRDRLLHGRGCRCGRDGWRGAHRTVRGAADRGRDAVAGADGGGAGANAAADCGDGAASPRRILLQRVGDRCHGPRRRISARRPAGLVLVDGMHCEADEACITYNPKTLEVVDVAALPKGVFVTVACVKADDEQHHYGPGKPDPGDVWVALPVRIPLQATWVTAKLAVLGDTSDAAYDLSFYYGKVGRIDRLAATKSIGSGNDTQTADGTVHMLDIGLPPPWQDVPQDLNFQAKVEFHTKHENALLMTTSYSFGSFLPPT